MAKTNNRFDTKYTENGVWTEARFRVRYTVEGICCCVRVDNPKIQMLLEESIVDGLIEKRPKPKSANERLAKLKQEIKELQLQKATLKSEVKEVKRKRRFRFRPKKRRSTYRF